MNAVQILLGVVLVAFGGLTAEAVYQHGLVGIFEAMLANLATITAFADLTIALSLVIVWMWLDARERNATVLPYILLTLGLGSVGPLLYLIVRFANAPASARAGVPAGAHRA